MSVHLGLVSLVKSQWQQKFWNAKINHQYVVPFFDFFFP
jgi:hypothetical protein